MLLIKPPIDSKTTWEECDNLMTTIHHLLTGATVNFSILSLGGKSPTVWGLHTPNQQLEKSLISPIEDHFNYPVIDGSYELEILTTRHDDAKILHLHPPKQEAIEHPPVKKDPLAIIENVMKTIPKNQLVGISWLLRGNTNNTFDAHGVCFSIGKDAHLVMSYVAAAYAVIGFSHATEPLMPNLAWKNILSDKIRFPKTKISTNQATQVWHFPIGEQA